MKPFSIEVWIERVGWGEGNSLFQTSDSMDFQYSFEKLSDDRKGETFVDNRKRVTKDRELQTKRIVDIDVVPYNASLHFLS